MKKNCFVLLSFIVSSILILTNCSSGSGGREETSEKGTVKIVEESEIIATDEFLKFCDEFYNDKDYNPARFKIKQEGFKGKWIVLSGKISSITEEGNICIEINNYDELFGIRGIKASFDFGSPEKVMNFEIGQEIKIKVKYDYVDISYYYYIFYFENPQIIE